MIKNPKNTEQAKEVLKAYEENDYNAVNMSKAFDRPQRTIREWIKKAKEIVNNKGYDITPSHFVKGYSTLYDGDGNVKQEWVKTDVKKEDTIKAMREFLDGMGDDIPRVEPTKNKTQTLSELLSLYVLTDAHIGMRSDEWNMELAEKTIIGWIDSAVSQSPASDTAVLCLQGDTGHFDSLEAVTPAHGHILDADCNARSMNRLIIKLLRYCVAKLLTKHKNVQIIYAVGNHDQYTAVIQSEWINVLYEDESRVKVDITNDIYHCVEWGDTSLFFHHGHKRNLNNITSTFAGKFRGVFGRTKKSYGHIGHYHHQASKEDSIMKVEIHPTLSGKDDYAVNGGWQSMRAAHTIVYHRKYGEVGRITICPEMVL